MIGHTCAHIQIGIGCQAARRSLQIDKARLALRSRDACSGQYRVKLEQTDRIANQGVRSQTDSEAQTLTGGGAQIVLTNAAVGSGQKHDGRGGHGRLLVNGQNNGVARLAHIASLVKRHDAQSVLSCTKRDILKQEGAIRGVRGRFCNFFARIDHAVVVQIAEQHNTRAGFGHAVEGVPSQLLGQAITTAGARVQTRTQQQAGLVRSRIDHH